MGPKRYLTSGAVVEVIITNVGSIRNRFAAFEGAEWMQQLDRFPKVG
jgi:hypothetical protein